jgi:16S rRNA (guanine527-N7)-methyltransferase
VISQPLIEAGLVAIPALSPPAGAGASLVHYLELIAKWNKVYNLTAIQDPDRMVVEHALDSVSIAPLLRPRRILDVGSGAGLPGIPLAVVRPQWHLTLLDSSQKRCAFLRQATIELTIQNVEIACARVEQFQPAAPFDTIVSRAFAETAHFALCASGFLSDDGVMIAMKGVYPGDELARLPDTVRVVDVVKLDVPGLKAQRHAVIMTKA